MRLDLHQAQSEVFIWAQHNFGDNVSKVTEQRLDEIAPLLGLAEEVGELVHAVLKRHQGIRGFANQDTYQDAIEDAIGDIMIYLMDFCGRANVDLEAATMLTMSKVLKRDWLVNPNGPTES